MARLSTARAAEHLGITVQALRSALKRARAARASGETGPHLFPEPNPLDSVDGRTPRWTTDALEAWAPLGRGARTNLNKRES